MDIIVLVKVIDGKVQDLHNRCFKNLKVAEEFVKRMPAQTKKDIHYVALKLDPIEKIITKETLDEARPETTEDPVLQSPARS